MLISAFLGGLILNLMPCVFPILSIKLLSLLKVSKSSAAIIRQQNLGYVAGVMLSFLGVALLLSGLRAAGHLVGWGFQLQSPVFLTVLCWLFFLLALNLLGLFEIDFIDSGLGGKWTRLGGFWGSFFTGVLAVVVASPCTAPFMGVALGFGLSQPTPLLIAVFLTLGFGLAFPYALMIVVPSALWFLPKPGPWMVTVKKVLAIPLFITVLWLCWVLTQITGIMATVVVTLGCALLLVSILSSLHKTLVRAVTALVLLAALVYVNTSSHSVQGELAAAHGGWQPFSEKLMSDMKGRNVFVNMTADWCLTCKVNERLIFSDPEVLELLKSKNVNLVMGDWTQRNAEITKFLNTYQRVGVPFYVFFSQAHPEGFILPEVMTKSKFIELVRTEFP
jgi:thiol:disulfide interchange protein DsbD